jgi:hypothetical protein
MLQLGKVYPPARTDEEASMQAMEKQANKLALIKRTNELMPAGQPNYLDVIKYPMISKLIGQIGEPSVLLILSIMVRDFCGSLNVARNMNEDQILEAATMLMNECGNFRLEDYTMMFALVKRGELIKIYERIDITFFTEILDKYWERRRDAARELEASEELHDIGPSVHMSDIPNPSEITRRDTKGNDVKLSDCFMGFGDGLRQLREGIKDNQDRTKPKP